jgi:hypothetical protein
LRAVCLLGGLLLVSSNVEAHSIFPGAGDLWNGSLHLVLDPVQGLTLIALGLALGRLRSPRANAPFAWYDVGLAVGLLAGLFALPAGTDALAPLPLAAAGLFLLDPGGVLSARPSLTVGVVSVLAGLAFAAAIPKDVVRITFAAGTYLCAIVLPLYPAALWERFERPWCLIAARIAGSWMIAIAVILFGASLRRAG